MSTLDKILKETELLTPLELRDLQIELIKRTQVQYRRALYVELKQYLSFDLLYHLPVLLSTKILSYLDAPSLCAVSQCSQKCKELSNDNNLWYKLCVYKDYVQYECLPYPQWDSSTHRPSSPHYKLPVDITWPPSTVHWKGVYMKATLLNANWKHGIYNSRVLPSGGKEPVTAMISNDDLLVTGSRDGSCNIWDLTTLTLTVSLSGHTDEINTLIYLREESLIVTGCSDGLIRAYCNTGQLKWSLNTSNGASIELIKYSTGLLLAASSDLSLYVWEVQDGTPVAIATLHGHTKSITCIEVTSDSLGYTGSWDGTVRIWNCREHSNVHILPAHLEGVMCILYTQDGHLLSGGGDSLIKLWEPVTGQLLSVMTGHQQEVLCLTSYKDMYISSSADSTVRIWTLNGTCIHVLGEHIGLVRCIELRGDYLITAGDRKRINVWNIQNGQLLHTVHRQQNLIRYMTITSTLIITASPNEGTIGIINYW